ncbi:chromosome segregation protein, partial [Mycobacterium sp. ITM-2017-0098]
HDELTQRLEGRTLELDAHESAVEDLNERADAAQQRWFRLSALTERVSATVRIASERAQHLDAEPDFSAGPDP